MTKETRTDKLIELLDAHDPTGYKVVANTYTKVGTGGLAPTGPSYYMFSNQLWYSQENMKTSCAIRAFIAYAWYLRMTLHGGNNTSYVRYTKRGHCALAIYEFLKVLQIPYCVDQFDTATTVVLNETFDIDRLKQYVHPKNKQT